MNIAIIPARSGSKRIKNKNIKLFNGKPIIAWSIMEAKKSKIFDKVVVSTDSKRIAKIACQYGAETPFLRKKSLSGNKVNLPDVIKDALSFYLNKNIKIKYGCLIYATAPLIDSNDLIKGYKLIKKKSYDFVISVTKFEAPIDKSLIINGDLIKPLNKKNALKHTQKLNEVYYDNAQFTFGKINSWMSSKHTFLAKSSYVKIPSSRSQDIDNLEDWKRAEIIYKINKK